MWMWDGSQNISSRNKTISMTFTNQVKNIVTFPDTGWPRRKFDKRVDRFTQKGGKSNWIDLLMLGVVGLCGKIGIVIK